MPIPVTPSLPTFLRGGTLARVHVNQANLRRAVAGEVGQLCCTVKRGGRTYWCSEVEIHGHARLVSRLDKPLSCGARVWIETRSPLILH